jgi:prevent-host-death family protein
VAPRKYKKPINEVPISEFKAKCLSLLAQVSKTKMTLRVTRRGKPIADVVPPLPTPPENGWLGSMAESMKITGDVVAPVIEISEIEAMGN